MSAEFAHKENNYEIPMMPVFDMGIGRELGSLDSRLARVETDVQKLDAKIDAVEAKLSAKIDAIDAKFESKTDKMAYQLNRLDERTKSMQTQIMVIGGGTFVAVLAGIVLQLFKQ
jgi:flagellar capping protein FliD